MVDLLLRSRRVEFSTRASLGKSNETLQLDRYGLLSLSGRPHPPPHDLIIANAMRRDSQLRPVALNRV